MSLDATVLRFADFEWRAAEQRLVRSGTAVDIGARAFDLLGLLAAASGRVVTKDTAFAHVWPGRVVEENNLQVQVSTLRRVLGREAIATIPGRGYRFTLPVHADHGSPTPAAATAGEGPPSAGLASLPPAPTAQPLLGRARELATLDEWLASHRLVTLVGEGGIGKTRLALQWMHDQHRTNAAQALGWADLAPLAHAEGLPALLATALGLKLPVGTEARGALLARIQSWQGLLVLDNCEHLSGPVAQIAAQLLVAAPGLRLLATSQVRLNLTEEQVLRLAPLALPDGDGLSAAQASAAVQLLVQRARHQDRRFELNDANAHQAGDICRQLDGLALAIELAAGQVARFGLGHVVQRLGARLRLLTGGPLDRPARQRTLQATLEWSHGLLDEAERVVFRRLAVFAGGFDLQAALAVVCDGHVNEWTCAEALASLVDRCLVTISMTANADAPRYRLLESTRAFAMSQWIDAGERATVSERHARWMHQLFEQAFEHQATQTDIGWRVSFGPDLDNLRATLQFCLGGGGPMELGIGLAGWSADLWPILSLIDEGRQRLGAAMQCVTPATDPRAAAALWDGTGYLWQDADPQRALEARRHAEALWRQVGDPRWVRSVLGQAWSLLYVDQIAESEAALSATADQVHHSPHLKALHRTTLGALRQRQDRHDEARVAYAEALALRRQMGDERRVLIMLLNLADLAFSSGDVQAAIDHGLEAMAEAERQTDSALLGVILGNLATAWLSLRQVEPAQAAMLRAVPLLRNGEGMVYFIDTLAWLAAQQGRLAESAGLLGHADGALLALGVVRQPSEQRVVSAVLQELAGQTDAESLARWRAQGKAWTEVQALGCALPQLSP